VSRTTWKWQRVTCPRCTAVARGYRADEEDVSTNPESQECPPYHDELLCILYQTVCFKTSSRHLLSLRPHDLFDVPSWERAGRPQ